MQTRSGHLTYCTNIHAGQHWAEDFANLQTHFPKIKAALSADAPMGIGLRLSNEASLSLEDPEALANFKTWLAQQDAYVFTMNGFPYGSFHHTVVKDNVHRPDWSSDERKAYTIRLINILEELLPEGLDGGISTSPLSYRHWFSTPEALQDLVQAATLNLLEVLKVLIDVHQRSGKLIHLDIEPEPDGVLESGAEYIHWYEQHLLRMGIPYIASSYNLPVDEAERLIKQHLCLCYDVCHFAVGFEDHAAVINTLNTKGLKIGKIQISAALKGRFGDTPEEEDTRKDFEQFDEPVYLHQVVACGPEGTLTRYPDLKDALNNDRLAAGREWRAHFHVPVSASGIGSLQATQEGILKVMSIQKSQPFTQHLEVETYTWEILPAGLKIPIADSIVKELDWVLKHTINE